MLTCLVQIIHCIPQSFLEDRLLRLHRIIMSMKMIKYIIINKKINHINYLSGIRIRDLPARDIQYITKIHTNKYIG